MSKKILFALILIFSLTILTFCLPVLADDEIEQDREGDPFEYSLMVPLPTPEGMVGTTTGIVHYIKTLYLFAMGIAGILAMAMIIIGGFQWISSGTSYASVGQAKNRISNAVLGLVILLSAYLILYNINPALVDLKEPYIYFIKWTEPFEEDGTGGTGGGGGDWCDHINPDLCGDYTDAISECGPNLDESCLTYCESDPCGVAPAGTKCEIIPGPVRDICDAVIIY